MKIIEMQKDLFEMGDDYHLAHCISGDYAMGVGTAKRFDKEMNMRFELFKNYPIPIGCRHAPVGCALLIDRVFNLVTKGTRYDKVDEDVLFRAIYNMRELCESLHIQKLAMTKLACGRDKMQWKDVRPIIENVFEDMDIEIVVCYI